MGINDGAKNKNSLSKPLSKAPCHRNQLGSTTAKNKNFSNSAARSQRNRIIDNSSKDANKSL
jgi:hypothetical protein